MAIFRWLLLAALGFAFLLLAVSNWTLVSFVLPDGTPARLPLPLLLGGAFLAGVVPTWVWLALLRPLSEGRRARAAERSEQLAMASQSPQAGN